MVTTSPGVVVLGGPNGAGKSTAAPRLLRGSLRVEEFVNADTLAQGLSAFRPEEAALEAGQIMLARLDYLESQRRGFAFESTLSSHTLARRLARLKAHAYRVHIVYLGLPTVDLALARVAARVRAGGHDVPPDAVKRRFTRAATTSSPSTGHSPTRGGFTMHRPLQVHGSRQRAEPESRRSCAIHKRGVKPHRGTTLSNAEPTLDELFEDGRAIDDALREAARDARRFHKAIGNPMATWRDGQVVWVQPEDIQVDDENG
jgi:predicted ABC-type ATPase